MLLFFKNGDLLLKFMSYKIFDVNFSCIEDHSNDDFANYIFVKDEYYVMMCNDLSVLFPIVYFGKIEKDRLYDSYIIAFDKIIDPKKFYSSVKTLEKHNYEKWFETFNKLMIKINSEQLLKALT